MILKSWNKPKTKQSQKQVQTILLFNIVNFKEILSFVLRCNNKQLLKKKQWAQIIFHSMYLETFSSYCEGKRIFG